MACTLLPDIPALFCCPTGPRQRLWDTIVLRAITFGFAGKHLPGEPYFCYSRIQIVFTITGKLFGNFGDPQYDFFGTKTVTTDITLDGVQTQNVVEDSGWNADMGASGAGSHWVGYTNSHFALNNLTGDGSETRISSTSWQAQFRFLNNFVGGGYVTATYTVESPFAVEDVTVPLFAALDAYPLSDVPVSRGIVRGFHPIAHDLYIEPSDVYHPPDGAPSDGAMAVAATAQVSAGMAPLGDNGRFADGTYGPPIFGARMEPLCLGIGVIAAKSKLWNDSRICEVRRFSSREPQQTTDEFCGIIGGSSSDNAQGIVIERPSLDLPNFITNGLTSVQRVRLINYEDPFFQTTPNPACCGFA